MSAELKLNAGLSFKKGGVTLQRSFSIQVDVAGSVVAQVVQNIGTSDEVIALGDVGTIGFVAFHNIDGTNYCDIGSDGTLYPIRVKAGEFSGPVRWNAAAIHARANTAAVNLEVILISN